MNTNKRSVLNNKKGEEKVAKTIKMWEDNDGKRRSKNRNYKRRLQNADKGVGESRKSEIKQKKKSRGREYA